MYSHRSSSLFQNPFCSFHTWKCLTSGYLQHIAFKYIYLSAKTIFDQNTERMLLGTMRDTNCAVFFYIDQKRGGRTYVVNSYGCLGTSYGIVWFPLLAASKKGNCRCRRNHKKTTKEFFFLSLEALKIELKKNLVYITSFLECLP